MSSPDEDEASRVTTWTVSTNFYYFAISPDGRIKRYSDGARTPPAPGPLSDEQIWETAERLNLLFVGHLPQGWRRLSLTELDKIPRNAEIAEVQDVVELIWRDQFSEPTWAKIRVRFKRSTGRLVSWTGYIPNSHGPSSPSISATVARGKLEQYAGQAINQFPAERENIERAMSNTSGRPALLEWWPAGGGYQFKSARRYSKIQQLRLVYVWRGTEAETAIDANTGELFRLHYIGPTKTALNNRNRMRERAAPMLLAGGAAAAAVAAGAAILLRKGKVR